MRRIASVVVAKRIPNASAPRPRQAARWRERLRADPARLAAFRAQAAERERVRRRGLSDEERAAESRAAIERERRRNARARQTRPYGRVAGLTYAELRARVPDFGERTSLRTSSRMRFDADAFS